jgi:hypothetical protein
LKYVLIIILYLIEGSKSLFSSSKFPWARERTSLKFIDNLGMCPQNFLTSRHYTIEPEDIRCHDSSKTSKLLAL